MYIANVENSEIDVSGIRTVLVQGDSAYPSIRFILDPTLTGLSWRVRGTYLSSNIAVTSPELVATETAASVSLDWSVASDFTTYSGDMQLSLVGSNALGTVITKALGEITIQKDYSLGEHQNITLDLFEQLMAQANAAISKYPTVIDGNWYVWNVTAGEYQDTGVAASSQWKSGTGITGTSTTPTAFPSSGITMSNVGDMYLNASTGYTYRCTTSGAAAVALWVYVSNIKGATGDTGAGIAEGGAIRQSLVKLSSTNFDTGWADNLLQYSTMPTAAVGNLGQIAQFTGTTGTYTHGHIYECVSSGGGSPTYSWSEIVYGDPNSVSYSSQSKTTAEKAQARANIASPETMLSSVTIYVATTGNDTTGTGAVGAPYATITKALSVLPKNLGGNTATISIAAGTYTDTPTISSFYGGNMVLAFAETVTITGQLKFIGNKAYITSTGTITVNCAVANQGCIDVTDSFVRFYQNMTLANSASGGRCANGSTGAFLVIQSNASDNTATLNASTGRGVVARLCAQVFVNATNGTCDIGYYSDASIIRVGTNGMTTTTKAYKGSGGTVLTGAGVDLT